MNKYDRNDLGKLIDLLATVQGEIDAMATKERDKYDSLPDGLNETQSGLTLDDNADRLNEAASAIDDVADTLRELT